MSKVIVAIASDHAGVELKALVKGELEGMGFAVSDLGTQGTNSVDYPDFADAVAAALAEKRASQGVLI
ncbi:MAG TPA: RpiB/LacA/LacB family sugar-phosphate isomerase, partial [Dongiaceae bacterium]